MKNVAFDDPGNIEDAGTLEFYEGASEAGWDHNKIMDHINFSARNVARGIMQWDDSEKVGFTDGNPWTLYNREEIYNVEAQEKDKNSILNFYRKLIDLKKQDLFQNGSYEMLETDDSTYIYKRRLENKEAWVYSNFSDENTTITLESDWADHHVVLQNEGNTIKQDTLQLAPFGVVVFVKK
jgi:oligo-1,6-glucosidase/alpha-glucosidase